MKTNEAPERIYLIRNFSSSTALNTTNDHHGKFLNEWYKSREKDADVEYIRKDIFAEKTEKWLKEHVLEYVPEMNFGVWKTNPDYYTKHFIEDFKKYIEE